MRSRGQTAKAERGLIWTTGDPARGREVTGGKTTTRDAGGMPALAERGDRRAIDLRWVSYRGAPFFLPRHGQLVSSRTQIFHFLLLLCRLRLGPTRDAVLFEVGAARRAC